MLPLDEGITVIKEMEDTINSMSSVSNFQYPDEYKKLYASGINQIGNWDFTKGKRFIEFGLNHLKKEYNLENYVPFALNSSIFACFILDDLDNKKVRVINAHASPKYFLRCEYENFNVWLEDAIESIDET